MHPATGKTDNYQDPSLGLDTVFVSKDGSENVSLTVGERRLNGCRVVSSLGEFAPTPPSSIYVSSNMAWRMAGWRWGGESVMNVLTVATFAQVA